MTARDCIIEEYAKQVGLNREDIAVAPWEETKIDAAIADPRFEVNQILAGLRWARENKEIWNKGKYTLSWLFHPGVVDRLVMQGKIERKKEFVWNEQKLQKAGWM